MLSRRLDRVQTQVEVSEHLVKAGNPTHISFSPIVDMPPPAPPPQQEEDENAVPPALKTVIPAAAPPVRPQKRLTLQRLREVGQSVLSF